MKRAALAAAVAVAAGLTLAAAPPASAQETGTFTLTQGGNQIATESFTRSGERLDTQLDITGQGILTTGAELGTEATVDRVELRVLPAGSPDAEPLQSVAAEFRSDSVYFEQPIGTEAGASAAADGTVPYINPSPSYMEQILRRARAIGGSEVTVQVWLQTPNGPQVVPATVAFEAEAATLTLGNATIQAETDDQGRLLGAEIPAQGLTIERQ